MKKVEVQKKTKYSRQKEQFQQDKKKGIQWDQNKEHQRAVQDESVWKGCHKVDQKKGHLKDCGLTPPK